MNNSSTKPPIPETSGAANSLWGGRFSAGPSSIMQRINASIGFDRKLWWEDIEGSKAHAAMLAKQGIVSQADAEEIQRGLDLIATEIEIGRAHV